MKHILTKKEEDSIKRLARFCKTKLVKSQLVGQGGLLPITDSYEVRCFLDAYFEARGISATITDAEVLGFRSVGMHIDNIYTDGVETIIVPIKGTGEMCHFRNNKIKESHFNCKRNSYTKRIIPLRLDQTKPHSFISDTDCYAIIAGVDSESLNKLYEDEN